MDSTSWTSINTDLYLHKPKIVNREFLQNKNNNKLCRQLEQEIKKQFYPKPKTFCVFKSFCWTKKSFCRKLSLFSIKHNFLNEYTTGSIIICTVKVVWNIYFFISSKNVFFNFFVLLSIWMKNKIIKKCYVVVFDVFSVAIFWIDFPKLQFASSMCIIFSVWYTINSCCLQTHQVFNLT